MLVLILLLALLIVTPNVWFTKAQRYTDVSVGYCFPSLAGASWISLILFIAIFVFGVYAYPYALCFVFTVLIIYKLLSLAGVDRHEFGVTQPPSNARALPPRREWQTGLTIVLLLADLTLYSPLTAFFTGYCVLQVASLDSLWMQSLLVNICFTFFKLTTIKRFCNLYIYLIRVPAIRHRLLCQK